MGAQNYVVGLDGGEYYLDVLTVPAAFRLNSILSYMNIGEYTEKDKIKVANYIKRLGEIQSEKGTSYMKKAMEWEENAD